VRRRDLAVVETLLARDATLAGAPAPDGESPVLLAVYQGARDIVEALLARRPVLTAFEAAAVGDVERLRTVLAAEPALVRAHAHDGWTLLHLAAFFGHGDAVDLLLRAGADVRARSTNALANTALHAALAGRGDVRIAASLLARGAEVDATAGSRWTPLHLAANRGDLTLVEMLLARGADATALTEDGKTPLRIAEARADAREARADARGARADGGGHAAVARRLRGEEP
jgi:ankyrin repeat protein